MKRSKKRNSSRKQRQAKKRGRMERSELRIESLENRMVLSTMTMGPVRDWAPAKPDFDLKAADITWEKNPLGHSHHARPLKPGQFHPADDLPCVEKIAGSISYDAVAETIEIQGTPCDDDALVRILASQQPKTKGKFQVRPALELQVTLNQQVRTFDLGFTPVQQISFAGYAGDDTFENQTGIASHASGGVGVDHLYGGWGPDVFLGEEGDDVLYGGGHNDQLDGGPGVDRLHGQNGRDHLIGGLDGDFLYGGAGRDHLEGGYGNDELYGGDSRDVLYGGLHDDILDGGEADDSLFGGLGSNTITGGTGGDRFLSRSMRYFSSGWDPTTWTGPLDDTFTDLNSNDSWIGFRDTTLTSRSEVNCAGQVENGAWAGANWTDQEIELIDQALGVMHERTGNTELFKATPGVDAPDLEFGRTSVSSNPCDNTLVWPDNGYLNLADAVFASGDAFVAETILHQVAYEWANNFSTWDDFTDLSTWIAIPPGAQLDPWLTPSTNGDWAYLNGTEFASNQGKMNPTEDFVTLFASYFMDELGQPYSGTATGDISDKIEFLDNWLDDFIYP